MGSHLRKCADHNIADLGPRDHNICADLNLRKCADLGPRDQFTIIMGRSLGRRKEEDRIDRHVKRFLRKCWNARAPTTTAINTVLGT